MAAPPGPGQSEPVVFETAHDLLVTAAALARIYAQDPGRDTDGDYTGLVTSPFTPGAPVFRGNHPIEHSLYFGHSKLLGMSRITRVRAAFNVLSPLGDDAEIAWQIWDGAAGQDVTANANPFGATGSRLVDLGPVGAVPLVTVNGQANRWLRATLATPVTPASEPRQGMVRAVSTSPGAGPCAARDRQLPLQPGPRARCGLRECGGRRAGQADLAVRRQAARQRHALHRQRRGFVERPRRGAGSRRGCGISRHRGRQAALARHPRQRQAVARPAAGVGVLERRGVGAGGHEHGPRLAHRRRSRPSPDAHRRRPSRGAGDRVPGNRDRGQPASRPRQGAGHDRCRRQPPLCRAV